MRRRVASIVLGLGASLSGGLLVAAARPGGAVVASASCVEGTRADAERTTRIARELRGALARLADGDDAERLAAQAWERSSFCYADSSELHEPAQVVLDARLDDRQAAARAAHLLLHAWVAPPWDEGTAATCEAKVHAALAAEVRANAIEHAVAGALSVRAAPTRTQAQLLAAYSERCRRERR